MVLTTALDFGTTRGRGTCSVTSGSVSLSVVSFLCCDGMSGSKVASMSLLNFAMLCKKSNSDALLEAFASLDCPLPLGFLSRALLQLEPNVTTQAEIVAVDKLMAKGCVKCVNEVRPLPSSSVVVHMPL